jgi:hypothetical protein
VRLGVARAGIIGYFFPSSVIRGMLAAIGRDPDPQAAALRVRRGILPSRMDTPTGQQRRRLARRDRHGRPALAPARRMILAVAFAAGARLQGSHRAGARAEGVPASLVVVAARSDGHAVGGSGRVRAAAGPW